MPGHVATLIANSGGLERRDGHTEAVLALLEAAHITGNGVLCEILTSGGEIAKRDYLEEFGRLHDFPLIEITQIKHALSLTGLTSDITP